MSRRLAARRVAAVLLFAFGALGAQAVAFADGEDTTGQPAHERCAYCHELDGNSRTERLPRLAGQRAEYLAKQLRDFRGGQRPSSMQATAELLSDGDIAEAAGHFSKQPVRVAPADGPRSDSALAVRLHQEGDKTRQLRACAGCHGRDGEGRGATPRLAGQHAAYLETQLAELRRGKRANDDGVMHAVAANLTGAEAKALASYFASLGAL